MSQHISPRTTIFYIWHHITRESASHHHFTPPHLKAQHIRHHTATVHIAPFQIHNYSTPHPHSTPQHISHHTIFHIAYHLILILHRHTNTADITTHCIIFHIWRHTTTAHCICHILHHHNSTPPHFTSPNFPPFALCNIPHNWRGTTVHTTPYSTSHILHFTSHQVWKCNIPHRTTFHIHITPHFISHHNSPQITWLHVSAHHFTCPHSTMHIAKFKYKIHITLPTAHIPYHTTHPTLHFDHHSACLIGRQTIPHHCITSTTTFHILHQHTATFPMHYAIPHRITTFHTWRCTTSQHHTTDVAHILHCTLPVHITATGWIRYKIPHLALQNVAHHTKFDITPCDLVVLKYVKCGVM